MSSRRLAGCILSLALLALVLVATSAGAQRSAPDNTPHLLSVPTGGKAAVALARAGPRVLARYESFTLVEASGDDAERLVRAGAGLRDHMREVRIGRREVDPALHGWKGAGPGMAVVQFDGPIKDAWLERLRGTGVRVVSYMAENAYLVSGSEAELSLAGSDPAVRGVVEYTAADKLGVGVRRSGVQRLAVQTLSGGAGEAARAQVDAAGRAVQGTSAVGPYRTQYAELDSGLARELASDPGVVSVQAAPEPELLDEVQDQILAGALGTGDPLVPTGPGYLAFIDGLGLGSGTFPFVVDVTDSGLDAGTTTTDHADFHPGGSIVPATPSRIAYNDNYTADADARDCIGHGTLDASIVAGFNSGTGPSVEDVDSYNYGLGVAPRAQIGATKIFRCTNVFSLALTLTDIAGNSYGKGARIANHSWGANTGGAYVANAQEMDRIVRDAQPTVAGNQEMVEVVSAGNAGAAPNTIGSLATAKNVIAVGASESVRSHPSGTDTCAANAGADDARDLIGFSSRGPTDDGRTKPEIVGPGTHITGAKSHAVGYTGVGVCTPTFPVASTLYSMSSGTSHAAPAVTGMTALFREWYRQKKGGGTAVPSPALTRAALANSATDLVNGVGVAGNVPNINQGWGLPSLPALLDTGPRFFLDQQLTFGSTGESLQRGLEVADPSKPVRVTLAWTDPPGPTVGNSYVNNLDLTVDGAGGTFRGNNFSGGASVPGGAADPRNNLESVYLPAGDDSLTVTVTAANIAGDGVPDVGDATDQDFALVVSNAVPVDGPVLARQGSTVTPQGDGDGVLEPGERFTANGLVGNVGTGPATGVAGSLSGPPSVRLTDAAAAWPDLAVSASGSNSDPLVGTLRPTAACGARADLTLTITTAQGRSLTMPIEVQTGAVASAVTRNSSDVPKAIPDNNPAGATSTLSVADPGHVKDVNVTIGSLTHTFVGDLKLELISPEGTTVVLVARVGGSGDNFTNTVFDDEAATAIGSGAAPFTGSFRPQADQLSRFDAEDQQGTWTLKVSDLAAQDTGNVNSWGTALAPAVCDFSAPPSPGAPSGLAATGGTGVVSLDWADTATATDYEVYRRGPGGTYPEIPTALTSSSDFADTGRDAGQQYCYKVAATNEGSPSPLSDEACATTAASPSGGGGPGGGTGPGITLSLAKLAKSVSVSRKGAFALSFVAPPGQAGRIALTTVKAFAAARKRKLVLGRKPFTAPATGQVRVRFKLSRKHLRVLRRARRLAVSAKVTSGSSTASKRIALRAPRPRR
jgi:subtilisin-like proprotein convertase family protein